MNAHNVSHSRIYGISDAVLAIIQMIRWYVYTNSKMMCISFMRLIRVFLSQKKDDTLQKGTST